MKIHPYLNFDGTAEEAFNFYQSVFGGEFKDKNRMAEAPGGDKLPENEKNRLMHISLPIGDGIFLMASDILPSAGHKLNMGNQTYVLLNFKDRTEADRLFRSLSEGGEVEMDIQNTFWGAYFGSFVDKFGIRWMINCDTSAH